ncbi:TIGR03618 family F420-dependent PPOX class oxidoreductase [Asanoa siamensis]|nr:TIGR03618 family F420-dependent PPOX class oxidoreductase [Asanoa siamensis]
MSDLPSDVVRLLDTPCTAHLATLLPDGAPHSVPVWVSREGPHVAFLTSPGSRKARNIARDPRVAISLTGRDAPNEMAHLRGRVVEVVDGDRGWEIIDRLAQKYLGGPYPLRTDRVAFLVEVDHAGAMSF